MLTQGKSVIDVISYGRHRSFQTKRSRELPATVIAFIMVSAQILSAAHFLLIPHTINRHTGKIVRLTPSHDHAEPSERAGHSSEDDHPEDSSSHDDECPIIVLLHQSKLPVSAVCTVVSGATFSAGLTVPFQETLVEAHRRIYLVSPSHSPPTA